MVSFAGRHGPEGHDSDARSRRIECSMIFGSIVVSWKFEFRKSKRGFITGRGESVYQKS